MKARRAMQETPLPMNSRQHARWLPAVALVLAAALPPAWSHVVEPDHPVSAPGLGNGGKPVDPGFDEGPPRALPRCLTIGCTVIVDPAAPPRRNGNAPLLACEPGDIRCKPLGASRLKRPARR